MEQAGILMETSVHKIHIQIVQIIPVHKVQVEILQLIQWNNLESF